MKRRFLVSLAALVTLATAAAPARAQEAPKPDVGKPVEAAPPRPKKAPTLLRVQVAIARYQGERKVASVPYTLLVTTDEKRVRLRMGVEMPIAVTTVPKEDGKPVTSFQYKNVGTNIDCSADDRAGDGLFQLTLFVESSSIYAATEARAPSDPYLAPDRPLFRTFSVSLFPTLRDGQTVQTVASTDPVTGEMVRIDVTLNVAR
jgi:hypothetical protein